MKGVCGIKKTVGEGSLKTSRQELSWRRSAGIKYKSKAVVNTVMPLAVMVWRGRKRRRRADDAGDGDANQSRNFNFFS